MSAARWEPVDSPTSDLLALVATDKMHPRPGEEWDTYVTALHAAADATGRIDPNRLRPLLRGVVAPRRIGAFTHRAVTSGLVAYTGEWVVSDDTTGRNAGRPCRVLRLQTPLPGHSGGCPAAEHTPVPSPSLPAAARAPA